MQFCGLGLYEVLKASQVTKSDSKHQGMSGQHFVMLSSWILRVSQLYPCIMHIHKMLTSS